MVALLIVCLTQAAFAAEVASPDDGASALRATILHHQTAAVICIVLPAVLFALGLLSWFRFRSSMEPYGLGNFLFCVAGFFLIIWGVVAGCNAVGWFNNPEYYVSQLVQGAP